MRVLAIDPSNLNSAFVVYDSDENRVKAMGIKDNIDVINQILFPSAIDMIAIEMVASYGMPVGKSVFDTCVVIGRLLEAADYAEVESRLVTRGKVKMHHCHSMRAKDSNIRQSLVDRFGDTGTKTSPNPVFEDALPEKMVKDKWAAFALAVYVTDGGDEWYTL